MQKCDEKIGQKLSRIDYNQHKLPRIVKNNQELPPKIAIKWGYEFLLSDFQKYLLNVNRRPSKIPLVPRFGVR